MCGINHLAGLNLLDALSNLSDDERYAIESFRMLYLESAGVPELSTSGHNEISKEEKEPSLSPLENDEPTYEVSFEELPESGYRPIDDITVYRYLCADRNEDGSFDIESLCQRLLGALRFRKENKCDLIVANVLSNSIPPIVVKCRTYKIGVYTGVDRHHRPVVFERLGEFFGSGNSKRASEEDWLTTYLYFLETHFFKMRESAKANNVAVNKIVYYADFSGIVSSILNGQIWNAINLLQKIVQTVEHHYPEVVEHITLFNVPYLMSASFNTVKRFLDPATASKMELFSGVPLERFLENMSENEIPVEYGGKNCMDYPPTSYE